MDFRRTPSSSQKKKFQKDKAMGRNRNTSLLAFCCTNHNSLWRCCGTFGKEGGSFVSFRKNFIMYAIRKTATILYHVVVPFLNFNSCQSYFPEDLFHILRTFWNKVPPPFRILYDIYSTPWSTLVQTSWKCHSRMQRTLPGSLSAAKKRTREQWRASSRRSWTLLKRCVLSTL